MHHLGKASPIYIVHHDGLYMIVWARFGMLWLVWLSSWWSWFISTVDGYVFLKICHMYALSCVNTFIWSWHVLVAWLCLIFGWISSLLIIWGQRLIFHHECLALSPYLVEGHKFLFVAKTFHVPNMNMKMKCKMLGKCSLMSHVLNLICFGCYTVAWCLPMRSLIYRSRHMARWLWHDMRCLWVFVMVLCLKWLS
jgi:hypothetical protein